MNVRIGDIGPADSMERIKKVAIAVGFEETVSQAGQNVRYGFRDGNATDESTVVIIDEKQTITVKNTDRTTLSYKTIETSKDVS